MAKKRIIIGLPIIIFVAVGGFLLSSNEGSENPIIVKKKPVVLTTVSTTTSMPIITQTSIVYITNPTDQSLETSLEKCRVALDEYSKVVETMRQTIRTYDDATMTNNQELADIALNSNALSVIDGLVAQYESCYK